MPDTLFTAIVVVLVFIIAALVVVSVGLLGWRLFATAQRSPGKTRRAQPLPPVSPNVVNSAAKHRPKAEIPHPAPLETDDDQISRIS